jgi:hypothetical protein
MSSTKSLVVCQKARLFVALASLNNGHSSGLCACYANVRSSPRPNLVPTKPLHVRSTTWRSSLIANLSSTTSRRMLVIGAEAHTVVGYCRMAVTTLVRNFIWPYNSSVLNHYTNSFSVSPSLASKPVRRRLSLRSSYLGASTRVSTTWFTT